MADLPHGCPLRRPAKVEGWGVWLVGIARPVGRVTLARQSGRVARAGSRVKTSTSTACACR